jgi:hypothetical protein
MVIECSFADVRASDLRCPIRYMMHKKQLDKHNGALYANDATL